MTPDGWLAAYRTAWIERDPDAAAALFTEDATYLEQPYGEAFVGVDDDPDALAAARGIADPRMEFRLAAPESLPFDDASFDLVVAAAGVLTWRDPAAGLAELARVVSDGGRVVVAERARAGRTVRELLEWAGLSLERAETVARVGLPSVRAFIAFL